MTTTPLWQPAPADVLDPSGAPRFGTYQGSLGSVDLRGAAADRSRWWRLSRHKRWLYVFVATPEVAVALAIVDLGYAANAFVTAVDLATGRVLADQGMLGLPGPTVGVNRFFGPGLAAHFHHPTARLRAWRRPSEDRYHASVRLGSPWPLGPRLSLELALFTQGAPPPLTVVAPVEGGLVNVTQKWAGLAAGGELDAGGRRYRLDGGVGGLDSTHGLLARHTAWRWGFACGRLTDGRPVGLNLVEGFNEGPAAGDSSAPVNENAAWLAGRLVALGRARFVWNHDDALAPWRVTTDDGAVDLTLRPIAAHLERRDLVFVRSRFAQPLGLWEGTLTVDGVTHRVAATPGVVEEQDVVW